LVPRASALPENNYREYLPMVKVRVRVKYWGTDNNNNNNVTIFMVLSSWLRAVAGLHPGHLMNETQRQMAANPQTKSNAISGGEMSVSHNVLHSYIGSP